MVYYVHMNTQPPEGTPPRLSSKTSLPGRVNKRTYALLALLTVVLVGAGYVFVLSGMTFEKVDCGQDGGWGCINPFVYLMVLFGMVLQPILSPVPHAVLAGAVCILDLSILAIVGPILKYILIGVLASMPFALVYQILKRYKSTEYTHIAKHAFIVGACVSFCLSISDSVFFDWQSYKNINAIALVCEGREVCEDALLSKSVLGQDGMQFPDVRIESLTNFGNTGWVVGLQTEEKEKYCRLQYADQGGINYLGCRDHLGIIDAQAITKEHCIEYLKRSQYVISNETIVDQCYARYAGFAPLTRDVLLAIVASEEDPRDKRSVLRPYEVEYWDLEDDGVIFWNRYGIGTESEYSHDGRLIFIEGVGLGVSLPTVRDAAGGSGYSDGIDIKVTQAPQDSAQKIFFDGRWSKRLGYDYDGTREDVFALEKRDVVVRDVVLRYEHVRIPTSSWSTELHRVGFGVGDSFFVVEVQVPEGVDGAASVIHFSELIIDHYLQVKI